MIRTLTNLKKNITSKQEARLLTRIRIAAELLQNTDDQEIKKRYFQLRSKYSNDTHRQELLIEHHALVSEVIRRTLNIQPFNSQLLAGIYLKDGNIVEMKTGEGKTLAAVFAACFHAQNHKGVHVLTFNDYLSERDANWTKPVYDFLEYTVGYVSEKSNKKDRKRAYGCDITYVTAREAGFDFLRDDMVYFAKDKVHRGFNVAIIDEADSILIDEARVPLVISKNSVGEDENLKKISEIVSNLESDEDFEPNPETNQIYLTEKGQELIQERLGIENLYIQKYIRILNSVNLSLHAHFLLRRDDDYIIRDGKVEQIDRFTGRIADRRRWPDGLQAAIEAKEQLEINPGTQLLGSIALRNFLEKYSFISGMTGTALSSKKELKEFYGLEVIALPTEKPLIRKDLPDMIFKSKTQKDAAIIDEVIKTNKTGQPVLVGTESVEESERITTLLQEKGLHVNLLNAKIDAEEARIISQAGKLNSITISTAMAGRGTDIKLGDDNIEEYNQVASLGGLYVIGTYRHESKRIDDQLRGRAGRQGDPGKSRFFISLEDDLLSNFGIDDLLPKNIQHNAATSLGHPIVLKTVDRVQKKVEEQNYKIRKTLNTYAEILENQRKLFQENREDILINGYQPINKIGTHAQRSDLAREFSEEEIDDFFRIVALLTMDDQWSMHLHLANEVRESIHLSSLAKLSPSNEFSKIMAEAFIEMMNGLDEHIEQSILEKVLDKEGRTQLMDLLSNPSSTYTELITDQPFGEWMELLFVPSLGTDFKLAKLFFWPILSIFKKKNSTPT
ncbi:accessory Sec system translocase SecA2 [Xanthovirga aplysinae]|uniref:accessory Sec system translocase SecA2 n=1 Tax=Xanthovirga aplysinae TaxID=2529853 RepID=UPI0012BB7FF6|nr:accessory Sec system translocase SecA2 [Xanthovirga aplysinae]MTI30160.1 accessory Sec system translocase SecA2 [Xanthovirga aplysinae]